MISYTTIEKLLLSLLGHSTINMKRLDSVISMLEAIETCDLPCEAYNLRDSEELLVRDCSAFDDDGIAEILGFVSDKYSVAKPNVCIPVFGVDSDEVTISETKNGINFLIKGHSKFGSVLEYSKEFVPEEK